MDEDTNQEESENIGADMETDTGDDMGGEETAMPSEETNGDEGGDDAVA